MSRHCRHKIKLKSLESSTASAKNSLIALRDCSTRAKNQKRICNFQVNLKVKNKLGKPKSRCENSGHNVYSDYGLMVDFCELLILYIYIRFIYH